MTDQMVEAEGLTKRFGKVTALSGLTLAASGGGVLAVLGPNGAGKSTFVRMLATLTTPDAGSLRVAGVDALRHPDQVRALIGLAGQYAAVEEAMSGIENLEMVARLFGFSTRDARERAAAVLERLDLVDAGHRLVRTWSGGMRRRLDLGATLVGAPRVLLLDEPTTGLDPASRIGLWESVRDLVDDGTDVVLTTQYLDEADHLADRIVIIDHGRTIAEGSPAELKAQGGRDVVEAHPRQRDEAGAVAHVMGVAVGATATIERDTGRVSAPVDDGTRGLTEVVRGLDAAGIVVDELGLRRPTLDEIFLALTGHGTDDHQTDHDDDPRGATP
jgi:ABC-2 type transport system ATP-binding protein